MSMSAKTNFIPKNLDHKNDKNLLNSLYEHLYVAEIRIVWHKCTHILLNVDWYLLEICIPPSRSP